MSRRAAGTIELPSSALERVLNARRNKDPFQKEANKNSTRADWFRMESKGDTTEIFIYDEIGFWGTSASEFQKTISSIDAKQIDLHLNSPGGEVFDGVAIYNALKMHKANITVYVDGLAASAASFIAQAGDKVIMRRGTTMMVHDASGLCWGNADDMKETANILTKLSDNVADIYAQRAGGTIKSWRNIMRAETWYNAQEAVDAGLADEVSSDAPDEGITNSWNLSVFNYAGRDQAPSPEVIRQTVINMAKENSVVDETEVSVTVPEGSVVEVEAADDTEETGTEGVSDTTDTEGDSEEEVEEAKEPVPAQAPAVPVNKAGLPVYMVNGVKTSDPSKVQAHIAALEGAQSEAKTENRKMFIKNLCESNRITASQVSSLEEFVLDPEMTDKQYERWVASWDAATPLAGLGRQAGNPNSGGAPAQEAKASDELDIAKGIVQSNKYASMPKDRLEATASWQKLVAAGIDPNTL